MSDALTAALTEAVREALRTELPALIEQLRAGGLEPRQAHLTVREVAEMLRCSERKVRTLVANGRLRVARLSNDGQKSGLLRIHRASVEKLLAASPG